MRFQRLRRVLDDANYLHVIDRSEQQLAKLLGVVLVVVMIAATVQLVVEVALALTVEGTPWLDAKLNKVLGDLLNLLIALEVLQNITSYLRRHVVQIELVLLTAMTAVARKVIVLPPGAENKPALLAGLGVAVLALAGAYWLVRSLTLRKPPARTGPAIRIRAPHR
ncbi:phosphate-starvation-inducible PsiE family protein [Cyanobium sp. ATX 6A2]|uniref:phosphate-starvation-inducible PsiE family protein n=1 Tax=Cyanobium sp. ATX 6A2 TaxID=2823700 RepID=UPI0020CBA90E|nr:phosphate-starvation-inducible PsiE family protein [Cyanobium sp. ATX 6A2]MCP9888214.1 phosphate-starvation-inducible PsiE family protein [Cyanobium sp. ATX 6A2]